MSRFNVLLTNDDGPPNAESPYIFGLYKYLTHLGWNVRVVCPLSQKSWIGGAYHIKETTRGTYFYPRENGEGEMAFHSRPLKEGELGEWILLDGTPATCANVALHNLYPGEIDLVISGPNLGRNSSSSFAMASGTIGAALSAALSGTPSMALSYGTVIRPTPQSFHEPAHKLAAKIILRLWENWNKDHSFYNINIPLIQSLLEETEMPVAWTHIWRNTLPRLFKALPSSEFKAPVPPASPDLTSVNKANEVGKKEVQEDEDVGDLVFKFAPEMKGLINPSLEDLPEGSDGWALHKGWASVTPLNASFAEPEMGPFSGERRMWKL